MTVSNSTQNFYHIRYWPYWFMVGILWLLIQLPYRHQLILGKYAGLCLMVFSKKLRSIAKTNIDLCFPDLNETERKKLLRDNFISSGIALFETGLAWYGSEKKLRPLAHFYNLENIEKAKSSGHGVLLLGPHLLTLEMAGRLYSLDHDLTVVYRAHKNPFINFLIEKILKRHYKKSIERNNIYGLIKALKKGEAIWYTPDIDGGYYDHVFAPFFNIPAASITAPSRLAKATGAKTLLSTYYRREDGSGYNMIISPELENFPSDDIENDITYINKILETAIRKQPDQYLWQYKRFKTRPSHKRTARLY